MIEKVFVDSNVLSGATALPDLPGIGVIRFPPASGNTWFVVLDTGVYFTETAGVTELTCFGAVAMLTDPIEASFDAEVTGITRSPDVVVKT